MDTATIITAPRRRRKLFTDGAIGLAFMALPAAAAPPTALLAALARPALPGADAGDDADLIAACAEHRAAWHEYNELGGRLETDECPYFPRYNAACDRVSDLRASTLPGLIAKAQAARLEATMPNGEIDYESTIGGAWSADVIEDLLRLSAPGGAA